MCRWGKKENPHPHLGENRANPLPPICQNISLFLLQVMGPRGPGQIREAGLPPARFSQELWTCSARELTVRGSVDSPVGEIPWFLCASAEKLHARGPLPVKEIAIYYDRWEGEGSLCSLQDTDRDFPSFPIDTTSLVRVILLFLFH